MSLSPESQHTRMKHGKSVKNSNLQNDKHIIAEIKLLDEDNQGQVENAVAWLLMQDRTVQGKPIKMPMLCLAFMRLRGNVSF
jgi:hypothetical protein